MDKPYASGKNLIAVRVPYVDGDMTGCKVSKILKSVGEVVFQDDVIAEAENELFMFEISAGCTGVIDSFVKKVGEDVIVDEVFAMVSPDYDQSAVQDRDGYKKQSGVKAAIDVFKSLFSKKDGGGDRSPSQGEEIRLTAKEEADINSIMKPIEEEFREQEELLKEEERQLSQVDQSLAKGIVDPLEVVKMAAKANAQRVGPDITGSQGFPEQTIEINGSYSVDGGDQSRIESDDISRKIDWEKLRYESEKVAKRHIVNPANAKDKGAFGRFAERAKLLKEMIVRTNNKLMEGKNFTPVFNSITDKVNIDSVIYLMGVNGNEQKDGVSLELAPIYIKSVSYALEKVSIFNSHVVNVILDDSYHSKRTVVSNVKIKSVKEIKDSLLIEKGHVKSNALTVVVNNSSILSNPIHENTVVFNRIFDEMGKKYCYVTLRCVDKQASLFMRSLREFIQNPGCIILENVV